MEKNNMKNLIPFKDFKKLAENANVKIVTHPGVMHLDEVASVALIILWCNVRITNIVRTADIKSVEADYILVIDELKSTLDHHFEGATKSTVALVWDWMKEDLIHPDGEAISISEYQWYNIKEQLIDPISSTDMTGIMNPLNFIFNGLRCNENWEGPTSTKTFLQLVCWCEDWILPVLETAEKATKNEIAFERLPEIQVETEGRTAFVKVNEGWTFIPLFKGSSADALLTKGIGRDGNLEWKLQVKDTNIYKVTKVNGAKFVHPNGFLGCFNTKDEALSSIVRVS